MLKRLTLLLVLSCMLAWAEAVAAPAQTLPKIPKELANKSLAFLVVSDATDPAQVQMEKQITDVIRQLRSRYPSLDKKKLPVVSFHFNKPNERAYLEKTLNIHRKDLVFIGIVEHKNLIIQSILYRGNNIQNPKSEGFAMFKNVCLALHLNPDLLNDKKTQAVAVTEGDGGRLAFNALYVVDADGKPTHTFKTTDQEMCFNLFVQNLTPDKAHSHKIEVSLLTPDGSVYSRPFGGVLSLQPGEKIESEDILGRVDIRNKNGFLINNELLGANPGQYKVRVVIDGQQVVEQPVTIEAAIDKPVGHGQLGVLQCFVGDDQGVARTEFIKKDTGAFLFIILKNLDPDADAQQHTITVTTVDAQGKQQGRALGGTFTVQKGEDLSKREFPGEADQTGSNGILIRDQPLQDFPGDYKFIVQIDGEQVRELPFTLKP